MNNYKLISLLLLCMSVGAYCQNALGKTNKRKNIEKTFALTMNKDILAKTANQVIEQVNSRTGKYFPLENLSEAKLEAIKKETNKFTENCFKELTSEKILQKICVAYEANFNDKEIEDLLKFYESSTGRKVINKTPEITVVCSNVMISIMQKHVHDYAKQIGNILI